MALLGRAHSRTARSLLIQHPHGSDCHHAIVHIAGDSGSSWTGHNTSRHLSQNFPVD